MFKQSPSRNNRSKGIKVKHILQICVLLAVCIWLIYQVKHSHEKRREFEEKDEKVVGKVQTESEIQRFGRKDIPRITEIDTGDKHVEDEDEKEGEEEENKHEEDESEREDVRIVERDEERGGGDDEIDEHEPEKTETESEHEEDAIDEDKEREENEGVTEENEDAHEEGHPEREEDEEDAGKEGHTEPEEHDDVDKEDHSELEDASDDQDHDSGRTNTREAQEVLYRADDASSEVAQNIQSVLETENATSGHGNDMWGKVSFGQEHENKTSDDAEEVIKPEVQPNEDVNNRTSNASITEPNKNDVNLIKSDDSSLQNSTLPELTSKSAAVGIEHSATSLSNGTQLAHDSNLSQNATVEVLGDIEPDLPINVLEQGVKLKLATDENNQQAASADANKTEIVNTENGESLSSHNPTLVSSHVTNDKDVEEAAKDSSVVSNYQGNESGNNGEAGSDESSEFQSDEGIEGVQHDPIDSSDTTTLIQEEREARTDLDTLPEIKTEIQNTDDAVAE